MTETANRLLFSGVITDEQRPDLGNSCLENATLTDMIGHEASDIVKVDRLNDTVKWYESVRHKFNRIEFKYGAKDDNKCMNDASKDERKGIDASTDEGTERIEQKPGKRSHRQRYRAKQRRLRQQNEMNAAVEENMNIVSTVDGNVTTASTVKDKYIHENKAETTRVENSKVNATDSSKSEYKPTCNPEIYETTNENTDVSILIHLLEFADFNFSPNLSPAILPDVVDQHKKSYDFTQNKQGQKIITIQESINKVTKIRNEIVHQHVKSADPPRMKSRNTAMSILRRLFNRVFKCGNVTNSY